MCWGPKRRTENEHETKKSVRLSHASEGKKRALPCSCNGKKSYREVRQAQGEKKAQEEEGGRNVVQRTENRIRLRREDGPHILYQTEIKEKREAVKKDLGREGPDGSAMSRKEEKTTDQVLVRRWKGERTRSGISRKKRGRIRR